MLLKRHMSFVSKLSKRDPITSVKEATLPNPKQDGKLTKKECWDLQTCGFNVMNWLKFTCKNKWTWVAMTE